MKRMGIDASSNSTGYCIFEDEKLITYGKIKLSYKEQKTWPIEEKLDFMMSELTKIMLEHNIDQLCFEKALPTSPNANTVDALLVLNGSIREMGRSRNKETLRIPVPTWRKKVGIGKKGKSEDEPEVARDRYKLRSVNKANQLYHLDLIWKSPDSVYNDDDISDAILVCHSVIHDNERGFGT